MTPLRSQSSRARARPRAILGEERRLAAFPIRRGCHESRDCTPAASSCEPCARVASCPWCRACFDNPDGPRKYVRPGDRVRFAFPRLPHSSRGWLRSALIGRFAGGWDATVLLNIFRREQSSIPLARGVLVSGSGCQTQNSARNPAVKKEGR